MCTLQEPGGDGATKHRKSRGCKTTKEAVEHKETTNLFAMGNNRPIDSAPLQEIPMIFHGIKLSNG